MFANRRVAQQGLSLVGVLFFLVFGAVVAVLGMKIVPTVVEYSAIKKALDRAQSDGNTPQEIQTAFEKQRSSAYIESVTGKDLEITRTGNGFNVSVAYQKKIDLFGPASLVIDYQADADNSRVQDSRQ